VTIIITITILQSSGERTHIPVYTIILGDIGHSVRWLLPAAVIRRRKLKKDRQYNGQKKKDKGKQW